MANRGTGLGKLVAPPRFVVFLTILIAGFFGHRALFGGADIADAVTLAFDLASFVFLLSLVPLLRDADAAAMRRHAAANDANRVLILVIATITTLVVLAALAGELPGASAGEKLAIGKLVGSLSLAWLFGNGVYALHYAHLYYAGGPGGDGDAGGLEFPHEATPDYLDFVYFSFTMGMTFQTSDVQITGRAIRRIATMHSIAAFIFNLGVIAFTINALG